MNPNRSSSCCSGLVFDSLNEEVTDKRLFLMTVNCSDDVFNMKSKDYLINWAGVCLPDCLSLLRLIIQASAAVFFSQI